MLSNSLADLIHRPPITVVVNQFVRGENALSSLQNRVDSIGSLNGGYINVGIKIEQLYVEADNSIFTWNHHHITILFRSNDAVLADVWKV